MKGHFEFVGNLTIPIACISSMGFNLSQKNLQTHKAPVKRSKNRRGLHLSWLFSCRSAAFLSSALQNSPLSFCNAKYQPMLNKKVVAALSEGHLDA
jgi:hypothetical protein